MNIVEALKLCKEQGKRVRPVWWDKACWVEYDASRGFTSAFRHRSRLDNWKLSLHEEEDFLGEWEEVPS